MREVAADVRRAARARPPAAPVLGVAALIARVLRPARRAAPSRRRRAVGAVRRRRGDRLARDQRPPDDARLLETIVEGSADGVVRQGPRGPLHPRQRGGRAAARDRPRRRARPAPTRSCSATTPAPPAAPATRRCSPPARRAATGAPSP